MTHSNAWDDSYEVEFTDDNYGYEIDNYVRKLILGVRERMEVDHVWKVGTDTDGYHNKLTMPVQTSAPTAVGNTGFVYTKDVDEKAELFFRDEDGNEVQFTSGGKVIVGELTSKVIEIGDWNMDSTLTVNIPHGLTLANIRTIFTLIRNDIDSARHPLDSCDTAGVSRGNSWAGETNIVCSRTAAKLFDADIYDKTSYNRGWITIWYVI